MWRESQIFSFNVFVFPDYLALLPPKLKPETKLDCKIDCFCRMCKLTLTLHTSKKGCPNFETNAVIGLPGQIIEGENYLEIVKEEGALTTKGYDHLILRNLWSF